MFNFYSVVLTSGGHVITKLSLKNSSSLDHASEVLTKGSFGIR